MISPSAVTLFSYRMDIGFLATLLSILCFFFFSPFSIILFLHSFFRCLFFFLNFGLIFISLLQIVLPYIPFSFQSFDVFICLFILFLFLSSFLFYFFQASSRLNYFLCYAFTIRLIFHSFIYSFIHSYFLIFNLIVTIPFYTFKLLVAFYSLVIFMHSFYGVRYLLQTFISSILFSCKLSFSPSFFQYHSRLFAFIFQTSFSLTKSPSFPILLPLFFFQFIFLCAMLEYICFSLHIDL